MHFPVNVIGNEKACHINWQVCGLISVRGTHAFQINIFSKINIKKHVLPLHCPEIPKTVSKEKKMEFSKYLFHLCYWIFQCDTCVYCSSVGKHDHQNTVTNSHFQGKCAVCIYKLYLLKTLRAFSICPLCQLHDGAVAVTL